MRALVVCLALALAGVAPGASAAARLAQVTLSVPGMTCGLCPITIRKALQKVHGVVSAKANAQTKTAVVRYDPRLTGPKALIRATTDAGYPSTVEH